MGSYGLTTGKTWATGESVTAAKLNTQVDGATTTIANNVIGPATSTNQGVAIFNGDDGELLADPAVLISTANVSSSSTDAQIPTGEAVYDGMVTYVAAQITAIPSVGNRWAWGRIRSTTPSKLYGSTNISSVGGSSSQGSITFSPALDSTSWILRLTSHLPGTHMLQHRTTTSTTTTIYWECFDANNNYTSAGDYDIEVIGA